MTTETNKAADTQHPEDESSASSPFQDGVWYDAKAVRLPSNNNVGWTMGPSGTDGDQVVWDLDVDPGTLGGKTVRRQMFNNMSTPAGISILCYAAKYLGCKGADMDQWTVDPTISVSVLFESEEYPPGSDRYTQKIKKIWPKRPTYEAKVVKAKTLSYREKIAQAQAQNADYEQKRAEGQVGGNRSAGRGNSLPADPASNSGSERDDFSRPNPGSNGKRERF